MDWLTQNKFKNGLIIVLLALNVLTVSIIWMQTAKRSETPPKEEAPRGSESVSLMKQVLDLDEAQTKRFDSLMADRRDQSKEYGNRLSELKRELAEELFQSNPDTAMANAKAAEIGDLQSKVEMMRFRHFRELLAICTPEQQVQFKPIVVEVFGRKPPKDESGVTKPPREAREEKQPREQKMGGPQRVEPTAPREGKPAPPSVDEKLEKYSERLALSDEQRQKVRAVLETTRKKSEQLRQKENPDPVEIETEKERLRREEDENIMNILNEDQKREFAKLVSNRRK